MLVPLDISRRLLRIACLVPITFLLNEELLKSGLLHYSAKVAPYFISLPVSFGVKKYRLHQHGTVIQTTNYHLIPRLERFSAFTEIILTLS